MNEKKDNKYSLKMMMLAAEKNLEKPTLEALDRGEYWLPFFDHWFQLISFVVMCSDMATEILRKEIDNPPVTKMLLELLSQYRAVFGVYEECEVTDEMRQCVRDIQKKAEDQTKLVKATQAYPELWEFNG